MTISQTSAAPDNGGFYFGPPITDRDPSIKKCRHRKVFGMIQAMCADLNLKQIPPNLQSNIQVCTKNNIFFFLFYLNKLYILMDFINNHY